MFRICWAKYIIDKKINGYYLWERTGAFKYKERLSGVESLVDFFVKDDINDFAEHILTKEQAKKAYYDDSYKANYKTHIELSTSSALKEDKFFDYGTFNQFMREFTKVELEEGWKREIEYPKSFFTDKPETKVHASLILFDSTYMIMKTLSDYVQFLKFIKSKALEINVDDKKINKWSI